jgi:hypothetical protein
LSGFKADLLPIDEPHLRRILRDRVAHYNLVSYCPTSLCSCEQVFVLFGIKYCGSARSCSYSSLQCLTRFTLQHIPADNPWPICKRMVGGEIAAIDGEPESFRAYVEQGGGISQVHPLLLLWLVGLMARNAMMAAQRGDPLSRPTVSAPSKMTITVQNAAMRSSLQMRAKTATASISSRDVCVLH